LDGRGSLFIRNFLRGRTGVFYLAGSNFEATTGRLWNDKFVERDQFFHFSENIFGNYRVAAGLRKDLG
jgi:hypothetical protein